MLSPPSEAGSSSRTSGLRGDPGCNTCGKWPTLWKRGRRTLFACGFIIRFSGVLHTRELITTVLLQRVSVCGEQQCHQALPSTDAPFPSSPASRASGPWSSCRFRERVLQAQPPTPTHGVKRFHGEEKPGAWPPRLRSPWPAVIWGDGPMPAFLCPSRSYAVPASSEMC